MKDIQLFSIILSDFQTFNQMISAIIQQL